MPYLLGVVILALIAAFPLNAQKDLGRVLPADRNLHVAAFGDFGSGNRNQTDVAKALARRNEQEPFDVGITMGDNFYRCGVRSVNDRIWQTRWEDLYTPLGIQFFATLGNHDYGRPSMLCPRYGGSVQAEIARTKHSKSWRMPAAYYTFTAGPVRFIGIDTENWSQEQLKWLRKTLDASSKEKDIQWRIVYGHHPIFTSGKHLNEPRIEELRLELLPVLQQAKVSLYVAGHDHDMERLELEGMDFIIAGSGGAHLRPEGPARQGSVFQKSVYGFLDLKITNDRLDAQFLDTQLRALDPKPLSRSATKQ